MTREQKRNDSANKVCRELRYQFASANNADNTKLIKLLLDWMYYAKKDKFIRP